jgi:hypothetical protein
VQVLLLQVQPFWLGIEDSVSQVGRFSVTVTTPDVEAIFDVLVTTRL